MKSTAQLPSSFSLSPVEVLVVLVQDVHVHVRHGAKHVVRLVLPADAIQGAADEVGPLVRLRLRWYWTSVALSVLLFVVVVVWLSRLLLSMLSLVLVLVLQSRTTVQRVKTVVVGIIVKCKRLTRKIL